MLLLTELPLINKVLVKTFTERISLEEKLSHVCENVLLLDRFIKDFCLVNDIGLLAFL